MEKQDFSSIKEEKEHSSSGSETSSVEWKFSEDVEEVKEIEFKSPQKEEGLSPPIHEHEISTKKINPRRLRKVSHSSIESIGVNREQSGNSGRTRR